MYFPDPRIAMTTQQSSQQPMSSTLVPQRQPIVM